MNVKVKVRRFNPEKDRRPYWSEFKVEAQEMDRVLDLLQSIKENQDGTVTYRRSCAHGVCGSDAMVINGRNRLACKMLVKDVGHSIVVEPLRGLPVIKDLVVDMEPFWRQYKSIKPFLINEEDPPYTERLQSPEARARFDDTTKCILCAACTTSCPELLGGRQLCGTCRHRPGAPLDFRRSGRGRAGPAGHPRRAERRLEMPHDLQLHGSVPAGHRDHEGDPGSDASDRHRRSEVARDRLR